ncbi:MAG: AAA family ATPase [Candidatus Margulisiibacteriota bacterium]
MLLKSLTLRGFKTFADNTEISLSPEARITAVVGPNGCGKSNVMDAARWVLGEDNPRELRVGALSDIIFAGTDHRRPLSLAEVTMLFDNSSGKLPVAFSEVAIKRRTFREGESEFSINKNLCRLKDIRDLLLDTGLGEGSYSIITQGQVDAILSSKGEERRAVFEEAAGINKYKTRKVAAERKLIAAEQNLLRINDLKVEVGEHLITLEEQARRAREYLELQGQVKETEIGLCKKLLGGILEKKVKLEADLAQARQASAEKVAAEQQDETELNNRREELRRLEIETDESLASFDTEKDRLRDLELNRRFLAGEIERAERSGLELVAKQADLQRKIDQLTANSGENNASHLNIGNAGETFELLLQQTRQLFALLAEIAACFGQMLPYQLLESKEVEATRQLQLDLLAGESARLAEALERNHFSLQAHRNELATLAGGAAETKTTLAERVAALKTQREALRAQIFALEEKRHGDEKLEREKGEAAASLEIALAKLEGEVIGIGEKLSAEYNLSLPETLALPYTVSNVTKAKTDVEAGKRRLRELEPVNLLAIEEFDRSRERLTFLEAQLADLNAARENLQNLIVELDTRAEESFGQTMRQLSEVFSATFAKLFAGGEARITLTQGVASLEAEIEIAVRPNGRRWLSLSLLSGGERSLCAIAILFSLLKIRPAPFCFLDEVDAALDEANIGRFTELLRDFSDSTQMIVITHNKRTMAAADNIYGVTMEEPGVSKIISMKLAEAAAK